MRICDVLEQLHLDQLPITDKEKTQIINCYSQQEWIKTTQVFLKAIGNQHQVPGRVVYQLWDMCNQVPHRELGRKEMWLMFHSLLENWDQMSCESRAHLCL